MMKSIVLSSACALLTAIASSAFGDMPAAPSPSDPAALEEVIVTARRVNENLQRVPVAVTVIDQQAIDKYGSFSPFELAQSAPGLRASAGFSNHEDVTFNLRGETQTFQTLFPAVIPYFAEVPLKTITAGTFYDLDDVQILRGPQGVRFGRVTDGGAVLIQPKMPTDTFEGFAETKFGDYGLNEYKGALNIPLLDDKILIRGAFDISRRRGYTDNLLTGRALDDVHYDSGRISATLKPADGFINSTVIELYRSNENGTANQLTGVSDATIVDNLESVGFPRDGGKWRCAAI
jgi:iron complex outermembrane receptor protein